MNTRRGMSLKAEIAGLEKIIASKTSKPVVKKATDDAEIKNMALKIKDEDNASVMSQIQALEKEIAASEEDEKVEADQNDDAMHNNPLADTDACMADDEDSDFEVKASDDDSDEDWDDVKADDGDNDEDDVMASDDWDEEVKADDEMKDEDDVVGGVEDDISDTHDQVIEEVKPEAKGKQTNEVVASKKVSAKQRYASILVEASKRLDRVATYLQNKGNKKLAYKLDVIADSIDSRLKQISK